MIYRSSIGIKSFASPFRAVSRAFNLCQRFYPSLPRHRSVLESDYARGRGRGPFPLEDAVPHVVQVGLGSVGSSQNHTKRLIHSRHRLVKLFFFDWK